MKWVTTSWTHSNNSKTSLSRIERKEDREKLAKDIEMINEKDGSKKR